MSIRAYKIKKIITEKVSSFNCWHDDKIMDIADLDHYNDGGLLTIQEEDVIKKMKEVKDRLDNDKSLRQESRESLATTYHNLAIVLKDCAKEGYSEYYCF